MDVNGKPSLLKIPIDSKQSTNYDAIPHEAFQLIARVSYLLWIVEL